MLVKTCFVGFCVYRSSSPTTFSEQASEPVGWNADAIEDLWRANLFGNQAMSLRTQWLLAVAFVCSACGVSEPDEFQIGLVYVKGSVVAQSAGTGVAGVAIDFCEGSGRSQAECEAEELGPSRGNLVSDSSGRYGGLVGVGLIDEETVCLHMIARPPSGSGLRSIERRNFGAVARIEFNPRPTDSLSVNWSLPSETIQ